MASWDITIQLPPAQVIALLRELPDATVVDIRTGLGIEFGTERAAWVDAQRPDDEPDDETNVVVKDPETWGAWQIYDFLEERTDAPMQMWDDGGLLVKERRWASTSTTNSPSLEGGPLVTWDSRAVGVQLVDLSRHHSLTPAAVMGVVAASGVPDHEVRDRSLELAGELVRAGLLRPGILGSDRDEKVAERRGEVQDLVFATYDLFPAAPSRRPGSEAVLCRGPLLTRLGDRPITVMDLRRWMRPALVYTDQAAADDADKS